ncbi:17290_t:CDS:2 [Cetraspora pellucida]|uniref:17290_t:CDS:1 n=1 Tax=Cetraspora pellucida TaxID=1433469 RepID=A0A9N9NS64_9GLOM|nr:17290_t:CDS:2 [Cetraspora pellucida]
MSQRTFLTDAQKYELCLYAYDNKETQSEYSKEKQLSNEVINPEAKRHKPVTFPELKLALKEFILIYQNRTILSDALIIEKAKLLAGELKIPEGRLQFFQGWLQKFKERNRIRQRILHSEEHKKNKEHISIALCSNVDRSHKVNPLIIDKYTSPWCFKNMKIKILPMTYRSNAKAWMLLVLFQDSHDIANLALKYIDVHFLPPYTTSKIQPIDAKIIITFIKAYRCYHLRLLLDQVEAGHLIQDLKINILQAIQFQLEGEKKSLLKLFTIAELDKLINVLSSHYLSNAMKTDEFLILNNKNIIYKVPPDDQIIKELAYTVKKDDSVKSANKNITEIDNKDDSIETITVSGSLVLNNLKNIHMFLLQQEGSGKQFKLVNSLEKFVKSKIISSAQQTHINKYFK